MLDDLYENKGYEVLKRTTEDTCTWRTSNTKTNLLLGRVQQLTGLTDPSIGPAYVRLVSCWTAFIVI